METIDTILTFLVTYPAVFFAIVGYVNGSLFRDIGLRKIIAAIFVVPFCIMFLMELNYLYIATIPFLIFALIGFWGIDKTRYHIGNVVDLIREQIERFR